MTDTNTLDKKILEVKEQILKKEDEIKALELRRQREYEIYNELMSCNEEIRKNFDYIDCIRYNNEAGTKKQEKLVKNLEKTEQEYEEIKNTIIKFSRLKNTIPEDVFEETKEQLKIRKIDLKNKVKKLQKEAEYAKNTSQNNIDCLTAANECIEKKIYILENELDKIKCEINQIEMRIDNDK